jgi:3D (Asp-Asp-Asp) domain-containing protein
MRRGFFSAVAIVALSVLVPSLTHQSTQAGARRFLNDYVDGNPAPGARGTPADPQERGWAHFPAPHLEGRAKLSLWATYYAVPKVNAIRGISKDGAPLYAIDDRPLGPILSDKDFCDASMEGTVEVTLLDGRRRIFSYEGLADEPEVDCDPFYPGFPLLGRSRFRVASSRFGDGAHGVHLVPYRTIAVDPKFLAQGSLVYIPAARGTVIRLPNGETHIHDGYFYAADTGGAISGNHIDVFLGFETNNPFIFVKSATGGTFDAYVVDDPWVEQTLADAHWTPQAGKS